MTETSAKAQSDVLCILRREAEKNFAFLLERGFRFVEEDAEDDALLARVVVAGRRVALRLYFDYRDDVTGLRVATVKDGRSDLPSMDLFGYPRRFCGYRGGFSDGLTAEQVRALSREDRIVDAVRWYARAVRELAPSIVNDTEDFSRC
jgi:hypothetical protein